MNRDAVRARWPRMEDFARNFGVGRQLSAMSNPLPFVIDTTAPRMGVIELAYGWNNVLTWINRHIVEVFGKSDVDGSDSEFFAMFDEMDKILLEKFRWEKVTVFILFCAKCRAHDYKISYGTVKVDAILEAASKFLSEYLPACKAKAGYVADQERKSSRIREDTGWQYCRQRSLFEAWHDATLRLMEERGPLAIVDSIMNDDEYHMGISAMIGIGAMTVENRKVMINEQIYQDYLTHLY